MQDFLLSTMLQTFGHISRAFGIVSFLVMCYAWFFTSNLQLFQTAKQLTILFFCISLLLWIISIVDARRNK